jgi:hypothetical protein
MSEYINDDFDMSASEINNQISNNFIENLRHIIGQENAYSRMSNSLAIVRHYTFTSFYEDPINNVLHSSFENTQTLEKTNKEIKILSQRFCSINNLYNENTCRICLSEFEQDDILSKMEICKHIFHNNCVKEWGYYKTTCPICRTNILKEKT